MPSVFTKDCIQALVIGMVFCFTIEPSAKLAQHRELLQIAGSLLG